MDRLNTILAQLTVKSLDLKVPQNAANENTIAQALQVFFGLMAGIAVLIVTLASLYFALSRGNAEKANRARDAIIYAGVALAIALLASAIVRFAIGTVG